MRTRGADMIGPFVYLADHMMNGEEKISHLARDLNRKKCEIRHRHKGWTQSGTLAFR